MTPVIIASIGNNSAPLVNANAARIPVSAPAGPTILKLLLAKNAAISPAHTAVMIPAVGVEPDATPIDTDIGRDTSATVRPAFQLSLMRLLKFIYRDNLQYYSSVVACQNAYAQVVDGYRALRFV